jgi:ATP-binding cassette subfamily F protein 3
VFETIDLVAKGEVRLKIRDILGAFMFGGEASDKKVKVLSGGERSRLAMIKLLLEPVNFLILDEPTNHLDLRTKDVLKEAILAFDGTVIVVSHDREFLDGLVSKVYEFGGGVVREYLGGIYDFLKKKDQTSLDNISLVQQKTNARADAMKLETVSEGKVSYEQQKERAKLAKKAEKRVKDAELTVEKIENEIGAIEQQLATPEGATSVNLFEQHAALKKQLDKAVEEWELAMEAYSEFD